MPSSWFLHYDMQPISYHEESACVNDQFRKRTAVPVFAESHLWERKQAWFRRGQKSDEVCERKAPLRYQLRNQLWKRNQVCPKGSRGRAESPLEVAIRNQSWKRNQVCPKGLRGRAESPLEDAIKTNQGNEIRYDAEGVKSQTKSASGKPLRKNRGPCHASSKKEVRTNARPDFPYA